MNTFKKDKLTCNNFNKMKINRLLIRKILQKIK